MPGDIPTAPAAGSLRLEQVSLRYGAVTALDRVSLTIRRGEFLTLLGPSGSGKSSILNLVAGAVAPSAGRIYLDERDITQAPARERDLGMVFQNYALMPHMTVFDNVAFPLRIRRLAAAETRRRVMGALERVGLAGFERRRPRELSGGQQQRVGIARCIVYQPSIILMDEPLGALDKKLRDQMQAEIKRLHRDLGTTLLYVTHDQEEALFLSDTVCLMNHGRIEQIGPPEALYFEPASVFVADFIGDSNIIPGTVLGAGRFRLASGDAIAIADARGLAPGAAASLLVRPEKIAIGPAAEGASNRLGATIEALSVVGGMTRIELALGGGIRLLVKRASERGALAARPGETVTVGWAAGDGVLLPEGEG